MKETKHYLYIGGFELPDKNAAAHRVITMGKALKEHDIEVTFIGVTKNETLNNIINSKKFFNNFESYEIKYPKNLRDWIHYLSSISDYKKIIEQDKFDSIICYNFPSIPLYKLYKLAKRNKIEILGDVTEWYSPKGRGILNKIIKGIDTSIRMRYIHKKLDGLIVISKFLEDYYMNSSKKLIRIPNLSDLKDTKWFTKYEKSNQTLYLTYAGSPGTKDSLHLMVSSVLKLNRKVKFDIIGITLDQFLALNPNFSENDFDTKNIVFHGRLSHTESLEFIKKANYSFFLREPDIVTKAGFPTKFGEALCCNTPVITNNISDVSEYIQEGMNGIILNTLDSNIIAQKLENIPYQLQVDSHTFDYERFSSSTSFINFFTK